MLNESIELFNYKTSKFLFIVAEKEEIEHILKTHTWIENEDNLITIYSNKTSNSIDILITGVGKINAGINFNKIPNDYYEHIINIGTAGSLNPDHNIGDIFIINNAAYHDVDLRILPNYKKGQLPNMPQMYSVNKNEIEFITKHIKDVDNTNILTGDTFVFDSQILDGFDNAFNLVDMESCALLQTNLLYNNQYNLSIVKIVSDIIVNKNNSLTYKESLNLCSEKISAIIQYFMNLK
ncbi:5'-methylthioadenosine/S-adenosylhomocysteine nucleosidase [Mycoplasma phocoenae]|uniref:5'-methylthioadenosine/S-adenosylhomocysteine nucleosidase n=1 Tax=Mycoplasma phocoenae TaxID=754517 RepID=A0A858U2S8_9MOLU|nr:5'-methylthioadenosine/S-adenosylhomocysteine nucleosidase [Mycoplasma phocoenae]QJG66780.1 5'-methylthioadenosine/S-adenosylhomocysteine nucleosidase [Mycoplasma phocoenae]